jgi:hypothetical protein
VPGVYALIVREKTRRSGNRTSDQVVRAQTVGTKLVSTFLPIVTAVTMRGLRMLLAGRSWDHLTLVAPSDPFPPRRALRRRRAGLRRDTALKRITPVPSKWWAV